MEKVVLIIQSITLVIQVINLFYLVRFIRSIFLRDE